MRLIHLFTNRSPFSSVMILVIIMTGLVSCKGLVADLDEGKLPKVDSKLAVECYISPQSPALEAIVTESQPLFGPSSYNPTFIPNAEVVLSDGQNQVRLTYNDSTFRYSADTSALRIVAGRTYTLLVNDPTRSVKATCTVPAGQAVIKTATVEEIQADFVQDSLARIRVSWEDIKGQKNFYTIRGYIVLEETALKYDYESGDNFPFRYVYKYEFFFEGDKTVYNDTNLDGVTYNSPDAKVYLNPKREVTYLDKNGVEKSFYNNALWSEVGMEVLNIDTHYYQFYRSLKNSGQRDNPFVEPTLIYTNIEGGLGCFGAYNTTRLTIFP